MNAYDEEAAKTAIRNSLTKEEFKRLTKEAIGEKLDEYVQRFGWWSVRTLALFILSGMLVFAVSVKG